MPRAFNTLCGFVLGLMLLAGIAKAPMLWAVSQALGAALREVMF